MVLRSQILVDKQALPSAEQALPGHFEAAALVAEQARQDSEGSW